jgi:hypothetical protein
VSGSKVGPIEWAHAVLGERGVAGPAVPEVHHAEVWSTVWRLPTGVGTFWLKAGRPGDGAVEQVLSALCRRWVVPPLAVDIQRGWLLTRDAGTTVAAYIDTGAELEPGMVCRMVADYATVQRHTVNYRHLFTAAGIAEVDPVHGTALARTHADTLARMPTSDPRHISGADHGDLEQAMPALADAARALAAGPVPMALDHGDLATRNILVPRNDGRYRFFDFSDARWAHPFESLIMLLWECIRRWRIPKSVDVLDLRDPRIQNVLDSYLSAWADLASPEELRELTRHALRLAPVHRCDVWLRTLAGAGEPALARHGRTPSAWLHDITRPVLL